MAPEAPAPVSPADLETVGRQLGREPRGVLAVAHRCACGGPDVVRTAPRLPDGTPFPTHYYLTCPRLVAAVSRLESAGVMAELTARLETDPELASGYRRAHAAYLAERESYEEVPELAGLSAGGMPERVKCLHALVAHELAVPGANPFGREALDALPDWWSDGPCA
ncbi:MAG TPA: DUF501 domain-containing protein [Solirubrobacterales bacterium]